MIRFLSGIIGLILVAGISVDVSNFVVLAGGVVSLWVIAKAIPSVAG